MTFTEMECIKRSDGLYGCVCPCGASIVINSDNCRHACPTNPAGPWKKVTNFAKSAAKHIASGMPMCTQEEIDRRFAICQGCEFYKGGSCLKCGCPLVREKRFVSKLSWAKESCPVGKWGPVGQ